MGKDDKYKIYYQNFLKFIKQNKKYCLLFIYFVILIFPILPINQSTQKFNYSKEVPTWYDQTDRDSSYNGLIEIRNSNTVIWRAFYKFDFNFPNKQDHSIRFQIQSYNYAIKPFFTPIYSPGIQLWIGKPVFQSDNKIFRQILLPDFKNIIGNQYFESENEIILPSYFNDSTNYNLGMTIQISLLDLNNRPIQNGSQSIFFSYSKGEQIVNNTITILTNQGITSFLVSSKVPIDIELDIVFLILICFLFGIFLLLNCFSELYKIIELKRNNNIPSHFIYLIKAKNIINSCITLTAGIMVTMYFGILMYTGNNNFPGELKFQTIFLLILTFLGFFFELMISLAESKEIEKLAIIEEFKEKFSFSNKKATILYIVLIFSTYTIFTGTNLIDFIKNFI